MDSSANHGDFVEPIGVGRVIKGKSTLCAPSTPLTQRIDKSIIGLDEGIISIKVGEEAILDITR